MPSLYGAIRAFECLLAAGLLIQTLEFLRLQPPRPGLAAWRLDIQRDDVAHTFAWLRNGFDWLYRERVHRAHLLLRLAAAASLFAGSSLASAVLLFASTIALLIRWRGAFNGGSDFMTLVALTGLLIAQASAPFVGPALGWQAGLGYVCLQALTSYFISGAIKLFSREWRDCSALPWFLDGGLYGPLAAGSAFRHRGIATLCSWAFILWECTAPLTLLGPAWAGAFCAVAALFHFLVFRFFGLNRFFWAWLVTFPAIVYCSTRW